MLTIFTVPKPFRGRVGDIQRNAIESWLALRENVQVVLVGDEEGVERIAAEAGVEQVSGLARNARGTPRLDSAFELTRPIARWPLWCFVNADVIFLDDFLPAIERVRSTFDEFLIIGECRDLDVAANAPLDHRSTRRRLRESALERGHLRGYAALDYFVFRRGLFDPVPPFLIGRACFDNWLVWRARELKRPVVDATRCVVAIHQSHNYAHVAGGLDEAYGGPEARYNEQLAGGRKHIYSLHDATHRLYASGRPVPYLGSTYRARERARRAKETVDLRIAARRALKGFERPIRLLGIYRQPSADTTILLDTLARAANTSLSVLYATRVAARGSPPGHGERHVHWFPRSLQLSRMDDIVGREYPVNWAIWNSFRAIRPDCMIIAGWSTFAAHAGIAWCLAWRVPFLLVIDEHDRMPAKDREGGWKNALVRAIARRADAVLVSSQASTESPIAIGARRDRQSTLPDAPEAAAQHVLDLARTACANRSVRHSLRAKRLRHAVWRSGATDALMRCARRLQSHSERPGRPR